jgi:hypothetical protein
LVKELGSVFVDAYHLHIISPPKHLDKLEDATSFVDDYSSARSSTSNLCAQCPIPDLLIIADFYIATVQQLKAWSYKSFLYKLDNTELVTRPTYIEEVRLLRALYRFQLICVLIGQARAIRDRTSRKSFGLGRILEELFNSFHAWEIEEIFCIYTLIWEEYEKVFERIKADVHPSHSRFDEWNRTNPEEPWGSFDLYEKCSLLSLLSY